MRKKWSLWYWNHYDLGACTNSNGSEGKQYTYNAREEETQEMYVWSLGREDLLEKKMATHSSILAWDIPWAEESGRLQSTGS